MKRDFLKIELDKHKQRLIHYLSTIAFLFITFLLQAGEVEYLITDNLAIGIKDGYITNFIAVNEGKDYLPEGVPAPILQIRLTKDGGAVKEYPPSSMT